MKSQQSFWRACTVSLTLSILFSVSLSAQSPEELDDFTSRSIIPERQVLAYPSVREADILWEKRIWRIIDTREKMNLPFASPNAPLFEILRMAVENGQLTAFSTEDDKFSKALGITEVQSRMHETDTILTVELETGKEMTQIVSNQLDWENVKRFRLKEAWFFDARTSTLQVRILGIAPLVDVKDENGDFRYELPLFWVHYPSAREVLAQHKVSTNGNNLASALSWEDLFERRQFASSIIKENNTLDLRLTDKYSGLDIPVQGQKISDAMFNFEHDLWSW
jgi:gliding motility associated protien GldN